jgi:hypothetical protein
MSKFYIGSKNKDGDKPFMGAIRSLKIYKPNKNNKLMGDLSEEGEEDRFLDEFKMTMCRTPVNTDQFYT